jgi:hypothetical protein
MAEESAYEIVACKSAYEVVGLEVRERSKVCLSFAVDAMHVMWLSPTCGASQLVGGVQVSCSSSRIAVSTVAIKLGTDMASIYILSLIAR